MRRQSSFPVRSPATRASNTGVSASERTREQRDDEQNRGDRARPSWARGKRDQNGYAGCKHREPVVGGPDLHPKRRVPASRGIVRSLPRLPSQMLSQPLIPRDLLRSTTSHDRESTASIEPSPPHRTRICRGRPSPRASGIMCSSVAAVAAADLGDDCRRCLPVRVRRRDRRRPAPTYNAKKSWADLRRGDARCLKIHRFAPYKFRRATCQLPLC